MRRGLPRLLCALAALLLAAAPARGESVVPRTIVALYDGEEGQGYRLSKLHRMAEMPLNHLGLVVVPHDIRTGLPPEALMREARGVVSWFTSTPVADALAYLAWLDQQMAAGKRVVVLGDFGFPLAMLASSAIRRQFDRVTARLGLAWNGDWISLTYAARIVAKDPTMVEFERHYPKVLPSYLRTGIAGRGARSYLSIAREGQSGRDELVVVGPNGAYVAPGYAALNRDDETLTRAWYVNPFLFFRAAFATDEVPKLDTTTLSGRRIYYSHIDGDAWHNIASLQIYPDRKVSAAEVIYDQILRGYPDLPVTVAPISADLDLDWYGTPEARELARKIFALPNVEAGTHTHSHPFAWGFFRNPDPRREAPFLGRYPPRPGKTQADSTWNPRPLDTRAPPVAAVDPDELDYDRPRSYAVKPFDVASEVAGSVRIIEALLPPGKRVEILQWSGDTSPWEQVLTLTRAARIRNINGGDPRMDGILDSYGWISPVARRVGREWQIYSSGANENIYTDTWRRRYYAFRSLIDSLNGTERPLRVKPINVYYHFYSGEREEGLSSLREIMDYVRKQDIAPITASRFAAIADGFLNARIVDLGGRRWRIEERDGMQTVRFDHASMTAVDFARSQGVLGQRHHQGSLYVALDPAVERAVVALADYAHPARHPDAPVPYLVDSRWPVERLQRDDEGWRFAARGYGAGEFRWKVAGPGRYAVAAVGARGRHEASATADEEGLLSFTIPLAGEEGVTISVRREAPGR